MHTYNKGDLYGIERFYGRTVDHREHGCFHLEDDGQDIWDERDAIVDVGIGCGGKDK